jgi:arylsulfatase A-like enzyme
MDKEIMHRVARGRDERAGVRRADALAVGAAKDEPFFAFVHLWDVHFDFVPAPPFDEQFDPAYRRLGRRKNFFFDRALRPDMAARDKEHLIALYDGEIAWTDSIVGKIRAELEKAGILDDTVFALTSDHGTEFFEHGGKGHRKTLYDEVIRTPLVVRYPAKLHAGRRVKAQTRGIDVGPTLLELAGLPPPDDVLGKSLLPLAEVPGSPPVGRAISELFSVGYQIRSVRAPRWKLLDQIGTEEHAYFDLTADPGERAPRLDFESELGKKAVEGYLAETQAMEAFAARHPVPAVTGTATSTPPPEVLRALQGMGYSQGGEPKK